MTTQGSEHLSFLNMCHQRPEDEWEVVTFFFCMFPLNRNKPAICVLIQIFKKQPFYLVAHQQPKQTFLIFWSSWYYFLHLCFCLCQDLLTLQTVPFHYLHAVLPLQVNVNTSLELCWFYRMSYPAEKNKTQAFRKIKTNTTVYLWHINSHSLHYHSLTLDLLLHSSIKLKKTKHTHIFFNSQPNMHLYNTCVLIL